MRQLPHVSTPDAGDASITEMMAKGPDGVCDRDLGDAAGTMICIQERS